MKTEDFSETIASCNLKVGRCRQLIKLMKVSFSFFLYILPHALADILSIDGQGNLLTLV